YIKDHRYGTAHDLTESGYQFFSAEGTFEERFEIFYQTEGGLGVGDVHYSDVSIYGYDFTLFINSPSESITGVEIYDILGRKLYERRLSGIETRSMEIPTEALGNQILLVKV